MLGVLSYDNILFCVGHYIKKGGGREENSEDLVSWRGGGTVASSQDQIRAST